MPLTRVAYFSKACQNRLFQDSEGNDDAVFPPSQFCASAMLLLLIVGNLKYGVAVATNSVKCVSSSFKVNQQNHKFTCDKHYDDCIMLLFFSLSLS